MSNVTDIKKKTNIKKLTYESTEQSQICLLTNQIKKKKKEARTSLLFFLS